MSEDPKELTPYDLTAEPMSYVFLSPGWAERFKELTPRVSASERREQDRREWIEGIRRRLGLVAEVHRCRVFKGNPEWIWSCERCYCFAAGYFCQSQAEAFGKALAHARSFVPQSPEETPAAEQDAFAAALPARMTEVAEQINEGLAGVLPDGMRFEWGSES